VVLLAGGLLAGSLVGIANQAASRPLIQVVRVEAELLVVLVAALLAGSSRVWQRSMVTGLYVAATVAAGLEIVSFLYETGFGHPLWASFPFGAQNVASFVGTLTPDLVASTRDNYLATFIMLPALALTVYRLDRGDVALLVAIVIGTAVSLSRAMWLAATVTVVISLAARLVSGRRLRGDATVGLLAGMIVAILVLGSLGGGALSARLAGSFSSGDVSAIRRQSETSQAFGALRKSPFTLVAGLGAGAFIPTIHQTQDTAILEDQLLAKWTNFGLLSLVGTIGLLLLGGATAFRSLKRHVPGDVGVEVMALGLALPALLLVSVFSGTLLELSVSLPIWLLAGTVLATAHRPETASRGGRSRSAPRHSRPQFPAQKTSTYPRQRV
jgi:hypothetical protein